MRISRGMEMHHIRRGSGKPLLLVHGLGGSWRSWNPILSVLTPHREVIAVDLPGFGQCAPLPGAVSIASLANALHGFLDDNGLLGIDAVGSSMGARLVLEMARQGNILGAVVALDPGGFWEEWERSVFYHSLNSSIRLLRAVRGWLPSLTANPVTRSLLLAQLSAHPWYLSPELAHQELQSFIAAASFDELLTELAYGAPQRGAPRRSIKSPLVIGWGRRDRVCFPRQAKRALELFPDAKLRWFYNSGHFPQWDAPHQTVRLILATTA